MYYHCRLEHGYPTPSLARDDVLNEALPWLKKQVRVRIMTSLTLYDIN